MKKNLPYDLVLVLIIKSKIQTNCEISSNFCGLLRRLEIYLLTCEMNMCICKLKEFQFFNHLSILFKIHCNPDLPLLVFMIFFRLVFASIKQLMIFSVTKEYIFVRSSISKYARTFSGLMPMSVKKSLFVD